MNSLLELKNGLLRLLKKGFSRRQGLVVHRLDQNGEQAVRLELDQEGRILAMRLASDRTAF